MIRLTPALTLTLGLAAACGIRAEEVPPPAPQPQPAEASNETQRRMEEILRQRAVKAEADRIAGDHAFQTGKRLMDEGRLEEALEALQRAVSLVPAHEEARRRLQEVQSALGRTADRRPLLLDEMAKASKAREDQQRVLIEGKVREGERLIHEQRFQDAQRVLQEAQETVRWMSYGSPEADRWRLTVGELLKQAEMGAGAEETRRREAQMSRAQAEAARELALSQEQMTRRLESLRQQGREALDAQRWNEAERVAREIDALAPGDSSAAQLRLLSMERRHVDVRTQLKDSYAEEWATLREISRESQIPYTGTESNRIMRHPENWDEIRRRGRLAITGDTEQEPVWMQNYRGRLRRPIHFRFDETAFSTAKEFLEDQGQVVINIDKAAQDANPQLNDTSINLRAPEDGMTLENALNRLTAFVGLKWTLREETILITTEEGIKEKPSPQQYDVRDLIGEVQDYVAPQISIGGAGGTANPGIAFDNTAEGDEEKKITGETLTEFIKEYVDKTAWENPENSINFKNGRLYVTASPETHKQVQEVLKGFREQRTLQVLIQARFITINEVSFEAIGVDWRGLNQSLTNLEPTGNTPAGGWGFANSGPTDTRGVINNTTMLQGLFGRSFNGVIPTTGGLTAQLAFLDDFQVAALVNAVEKSSKANLLTSPSLLCFNTQRANMVSVTQQAYIQDFTAVVQVQAVGYDPEIGYVMTGIVFDVRPIVSADRKYVTLELRPTVSQLQSMRSVPAVAGTTLNIEAPIVQMQAVRTTVSVPDGGTLMIGGLTYYYEGKNYSAVPFLSKIPFLQTFFSSKNEGQNRSSLVILVKVQIIDQREIEDGRFGKE